jgi:PEP-CTERM motif-containing protein
MRRSLARSLPLLAAVATLVSFAHPALAAPFFFTTGNPDGLIGTLSRPASGATIQTETADDFILSQPTRITSATFTGLIPIGTPVSSITQVEIEFYHVFPGDSDVGRTSGAPTFSTSQVPTRVNSPGDVEIGAATRDSVAGSLNFIASLINPTFNVANTVVNGIHPMPGQFTGGEGPTTSEEVLLSVTFTVPVDLPADHYFFRPEALLSSGNFLWLSAPKPPGATDLQSWTRNDNLAPDWLRIGTDITHQGPFNAAFSLTGTVPAPSTLLLLGAGFVGIGAYRRRGRSR